jgi:hypothetical protein
MSQSLKSLLAGRGSPAIGRVEAYLGNNRFRVSFQGNKAIAIGGSAPITAGRKVLLSATPGGLIISGATPLMENDVEVVQLDEL